MDGSVPEIIERRVGWPSGLFVDTKGKQTRMFPLTPKGADTSFAKKITVTVNCYLLQVMSYFGVMPSWGGCSART